MAEGSSEKQPQVAAAPPVAANNVTAPTPGAALSYTHKVLVAVMVSVVALLLTAFVYFTAQILVLCFAGVLFSVFLSAPSDLLVKHLRMKRGYALGVVLLTLTVVVLGGGYFMGYTVYAQTQTLTRTLPGALKQFEGDLHDMLPVPEKPAATYAATQEAIAASTTATSSTMPEEESPREWMAQKLIQIREAITDFLLSASFVRGAGGLVTTTFGLIGDIAVVLGLGLFFAISPRMYAQGLVRMFPIPRRPRVGAIMGEVGSQLQWWFVGQLCSMVSIGTLTFIGLKILGVPMAFTLAILAGLMNFIPNFGPILAAAPAVLIAFAPQGDQTQLDPSRAGWTILMYICIQLLEGWVITPFFQQRAVELPPALIIISQVIFALLLGPIGLILATPILAAVLVLVKMVYVEDVLGDVGKL